MKRGTRETLARCIFGSCGALALFAAASVAFYMIVMGIPAIRQVGLEKILFGVRWNPTAAEPEYGIFYIILTSILGTFLAALTGVPLGILTAVYLAELAGRKTA